MTFKQVLMRDHKIVEADDQPDPSLMAHLRSVLKTPSRGESPEQEMNHRNLNKGFTVACEDLCAV